MEEERKEAEKKQKLESAWKIRLQSYEEGDGFWREGVRLHLESKRFLEQKGNSPCVIGGFLWIGS